MNKIPCICGHLEQVHVNIISGEFPIPIQVHVNIISGEFPIPIPVRCESCVLIGKAAAGVFHDYKGDNLRYLEQLNES